MDVGEIVGTEPLGVIATNSIEEILALDADCVLYAPLMPNPEEVAAILRSGKNVVTPSAGSARARGARRRRGGLRRRRGDAARHRHRPGRGHRAAPAVFSALSSAITFVRGEEFSDIRTYNAPDVVRHIMGFGGTPEEARPARCWGCCPVASSSRCGCAWTSSASRRRGDPHRPRAGRRDRPDRLTRGVIEPGQVAGAAVRLGGVRRRDERRPGRRQLADGRGAPRPALGVRARGRALRDRGPGRPGRVRRHPGLAPGHHREGLERNPGIVVTAMHCVNSIPNVCAAEPGDDLRRPAARDRPRAPGPGLIKATRITDEVLASSTVYTKKTEEVEAMSQQVARAADWRCSDRGRHDLRSSPVSTACVPDAPLAVRLDSTMYASWSESRLPSSIACTCSAPITPLLGDRDAVDAPLAAVGVEFGGAPAAPARRVSRKSGAPLPAADVVGALEGVVPVTAHITAGAARRSAPPPRRLSACCSPTDGRASPHDRQGSREGSRATPSTTAMAAAVRRSASHLDAYQNTPARTVRAMSPYVVRPRMPGTRVSRWRSAEQQLALERRAELRARLDQRPARFQVPMRM